MIPGQDAVQGDAVGRQARKSTAVPAATTGTDRFSRLPALIPAVSARILKASSEELDEAILSSLQEILQSVQLDRCALLEVADKLCKVVITYARYEKDVPVVSREINLAQLLPWTYHQIVHLGKTVAKHSIDSMPATAELDRQAFIQMGVKSALAIPLWLGQRVHHIIVVHSLKEECIWPESFVTNLRLMGEIFVSALERRNILKALEIYRTRLDMAATSAGAGLWELDLATGTLWLTDKARELFHFGRDEIVTAARFLEKIHPEDRGALTEAVDNVQSSGSELRVEYRVPGPDGTVRWLISRGGVQHNGANTAKLLSGVAMEITLRKAMEQKLHDQVREISRLRELLEQENSLLRAEAGLSEERHRSLGISTAMQGVKALVEHVANTGSTVLIQGETGTGKELIAQSIHQLSDRSKRLMVTVNCAALPAALIESELFGREKGAFTGALSRQIGRFELAHGSTLLLDEIAEMPLETQAKLLRVLQNGTFERLGSPANIKVDVRIVAATNRNLAEEVEHGRFRRDLFYRLNVFPIQVPPLRDRAEDIPLLVWKFVNEFGQRMGRKITRIADEDMDMLRAYSWPGNVRELRNVIERAMITSRGGMLDLSHLDLAPSRPRTSPIMTLAEVEHRHIQETLKATHGKIKGKGGAAELLGINPSTLYSRMRKHGFQHTPATFTGEISSQKG